MVGSGKPVWLSADLVDGLEKFVESRLEIKADFVFIEVVKQCVEFALSKPDEFKEFLRVQMKV